MILHYSHFYGETINLIGLAKDLEIQNPEEKVGSKKEALLCYGQTKPSAKWDEFLVPLLTKHNIRHEYKTT